jgi:hypothetical protein
MLFIRHSECPTFSSVLEKVPRAIHIERAPGGWYVFKDTESYGKWLDSYNSHKSSKITQQSGVQS